LIPARFLSARFSIDKPAGELKNGGAANWRARLHPAMTSRPPMTDEPLKTGRRRPVSMLWVFLLFFVVYNANFRCIRFTDTAPARVFPFALLLDHSLYLDRWIAPYVAQATGPNGVYFPARSPCLPGVEEMMRTNCRPRRSNQLPACRFPATFNLPLGPFFSRDFRRASAAFWLFSREAY
jgi:hypothetical protein